MIRTKQEWTPGFVRATLREAFRDLEFNEESHTYKVSGEKLTSTTTFISRFYDEFDEEFHSRRMTDKVNKMSKLSKRRTPKYFTHRWKCQNETAKHKGSRVHNYAEYNYPDFAEPPTCLQELGVLEFFSTLPDEYEVIHLELRMFLWSYRKSGTADIILFNKNTGNIIVADWKTNEKNLIQYYVGSALKYPFDDLYEHELNKYSLQLSDYQNMIEMSTPFRVEKKWIVHLTQRNPTEIDFAKQYFMEDYKIDMRALPSWEGDNFKVYYAKDLQERLKKTYPV